MAKLERIPNQPGRYAFKCECGYDKRQVTDSERFFSCERPVEAKTPACKLTFSLTPLIAEMEKDEAKRAAEKFIAEHERKFAEAVAILGKDVPPVTINHSETLNPQDWTMAYSKPEGAVTITTSTQSDVETKKLEKPKKVKKEKPNG